MEAILLFFLPIRQTNNCEEYNAGDKKTPRTGIITIQRASTTAANRIGYIFFYVEQICC